MKTPIEALQFELRILKSFADDMQRLIDKPDCDSRKACINGLAEAKDFIAQYEAGIEVLKISCNPVVMRSCCPSCKSNKIAEADTKGFMDCEWCGFTWAT